MSCEVCGLTTNLKSCGRCLSVNYCSREHQLVHWKEHKTWCNKNSNNINNGQVVSSSAAGGDDLISAVSSQSPGQSTGSVNNFPNPIKPTTNILCSNNFSQENLPLNQDAITTTINQPTNADLNSQICPSMASLRVCDSSNSTPSPYGAPTTPLHSAAGASDSFQSTHVMPNELAQNRDAVFSNLNTFCQIILKDMNQYGFCVIDNFLQNGDAILNEVKTLYNKGLFRAGQVVNNRANSNTKMIRGDQIIWVEGNESICSNIGFLIRILDSIVTKCNTTMSAGEFLKYTITRRTKAMIACYPGNNTKYVRHIDNPNSDGRCITSIYYLNKDYDQQKDGGVLRLFPQMNDGIVANIEPKFNRVIFFWSDRRNPHEVMPSTRMRFAITVWYFDANERAKAIQKYKENSQQYPIDKDLAPF